MRVTIEERNSEAYWNADMDALPAIGHSLVIASADKGVHHLVVEIEHHVGSVEHTAIIRVDRIA